MNPALSMDGQSEIVGKTANCGINQEAIEEVRLLVWMRDQSVLATPRMYALWPVPEPQMWAR